MSTPLAITQNDTAQLWTSTLQYGGVPIDLTGATVVLVIRNPGQPSNSAVFRRTATIVDAAAGKVSYQPVRADVSASPCPYPLRKISLQWEVTFAGGGVLTVPTGQPIQLTVYSDLG